VSQPVPIMRAVSVPAPAVIFPILIAFSVPAPTPEGAILIPYAVPPVVIADGVVMLTAADVIDPVV